MVIVELEMELYLGQQGKTDSINKHYQLFKPRVDTIVAHGDTSDWHHAYA